MLQIGRGLLHRSNSIEFRIRTVTETFDLGKDEPNPVAVFATLFELCDNAVNDGLLRIDETLQVVFVIHTPANLIIIFFQALAHAEYVPIGMAQVHFTDMPRHVMRRKGYFEPGGDTMLMH